MVTKPFKFPVVRAILNRHAEDAAFYWSQLDRISGSSQFGLEKLQHLDRLLRAHTTGLQTAGVDGWLSALSALTRWQKAGEVFVCTVLAVADGDNDKLNAVAGFLIKRPDELMRGVIAALGRSSRAGAIKVIEQWSDPAAHPVLQVAALRSAAILGNTAVAALSHPLSVYCAATNPHIRAAAYRAAVEAEHSNRYLGHLHDALADGDLQVRAEAAIALSRIESHPDALAVLTQCVLSQAALQADATGWHRAQATRRLHRWTRELAWSVPLGLPPAQDVLKRLPIRSGLTFTLCHGDLALLSYVAAQTANPTVDRYAGWVWQTLTGIDLAATGWTLPEPAVSMPDERNLVTHASTDADDDFPLPDSAAIIAYTETNPYVTSFGKRVLLGVCAVEANWAAV